MTDSIAAVPWNTPARWREANASLRLAVRQHRTQVATARHCADHLRHLLARTARLMEALCEVTCPACTDVCCRRAWVWFDFKDLLFVHLAGIAPPERQLLGRQGEHCRYAGPAGCRLERIRRPFVCTWYLCPAQSRLLVTQPNDKHRLTSLLSQIKKQRGRMEDAFIQALA